MKRLFSSARRVQLIVVNFGEIHNTYQQTREPLMKVLGSTRGPSAAGMNQRSTEISRSTLLRTVSLLLAGAAPLSSLPGRSSAAAPPQQQMRTSADYNSIMELTGQQSQNLGAGTISSRSRPVTGVILLDEVRRQVRCNPRTPSCAVSARLCSHMPCDLLAGCSLRL